MTSKPLYRPLILGLLILLGSPVAADAVQPHLHPPLAMAGKMLMVSNDEGTTEQRFLADGTYILRPVGMLATLQPGTPRHGRWRMASPTTVCTMQTVPEPEEETCLNLTGRRVGESWSVVAVRGGNTNLVILEMDPEPQPGKPAS